MNCPVCDERLRAVEKHGVEVDICPGCKGVWLDRGELEKILDMAATGGPAGIRDERNFQSGPSPRDPQKEREYESRSRGDYDRREYEKHSDHGRHKRRGGWLGDILEGFGGGDD